MPVVDNDGVGIAYDVSNPEFEETVGLVGGLGYGRWFWQWQRPALEDDYSLVAFDYRGLGDDVEQITQPTLLMHGERDRVVPVGNLDRLAEGIPHADIVRLDRGGSHLCMIERTDTVNEHIQAFLENEGR